MTPKKITIKSWITGSVLFETTATDLKSAVVEAARKGADLSGANLSGADLYRADLYRANLSGANLYRADLSGANLYRANLSWANLSGADLYRADLSGANLYRADLYRANLSGANLSGADLYRADLSGANLYRADLSGANLYRAKNIDAWRTTPLLMLLEQPGPIRAYKLVTADLKSPMQTFNRIQYAVGESYEVANANTDVTVDCGAGINVATWDWIAKEWCEGWRVLVMEFTAADIAAIPTGTDGKFRCHRVTVVDEITDLAARGIGVKAEAPGVAS